MTIAWFVGAFIGLALSALGKPDFLWVLISMVLFGCAGFFIEGIRQAKGQYVRMAKSDLEREHVQEAMQEWSERERSMK